jgi:hypothetical protein
VATRSVLQSKTSCKKFIEKKTEQEKDHCELTVWLAAAQFLTQGTEKLKRKPHRQA